jgi:hypothetical protein
MFLDSGHGVVFKGAVGPWYNPKRGEFHLSHEAAREVVAMAIESYVAGSGSHLLSCSYMGSCASTTRSGVDSSRGQTARLGWWACGYGKTAT